MPLYIHRLISPCTGCVAPYGFHNQLPLTDDTSQFRVSKVRTCMVNNKVSSFLCIVRLENQWLNLSVRAHFSLCGILFVDQSGCSSNFWKFRCPRRRIWCHYASCFMSCMKNILCDSCSKYEIIPSKLIYASFKQLFYPI